MKSERKTIHADPATSITAVNDVRYRRTLAANVVQANSAAAFVITASADHRARALCIRRAPITALNPKHPSKSPYVAGVFFTMFMDGSGYTRTTG